MIRAKINDKTYDVESGKVNDKNVAIDEWVKDRNHRHIIFNNQSYRVTVVSENEEDKTITLKVGNTEYCVALQDRFDQLLNRLGMDQMASSKENTVKAPMPGLLFKLLVEQGQKVEADEDILILEAMKMENVLKSPATGVVKRIAVKEGQAVEKNELLIELDTES